MVPSSYSTAQLTRLKIQLREQEQQEHQDRRPVGVRAQAAADIDAMMNGIGGASGAGDSNEGTVRFLFGLPGE
jgi:hypothetical protein